MIERAHDNLIVRLIFTFKSCDLQAGLQGLVKLYPCRSNVKSQPRIGIGFREKIRVLALNVLIADADANVRVTLTHLLEYSGYTVRAVIPGRDVVDCLATGRFKLLLLEIDIPAYHGLLLLGTIRRCAPTLPIIVLTSCPDAQTAVNARQFGVSSYLVKPINPASLLRQIEIALASNPLFYP